MSRRPGDEKKRPRAPKRPPAETADGRVRAKARAPKPLAGERRGVALVAELAGPNGTRLPRCQAMKSDGSAQCAQPARQGYRVCRFHGAGTKKRVAAGEKRPPGRPPIHGLYSQRGLQDIRALMDAVRELGGDLDDTDEELRALKAVLWFLLEQAEAFQGHAENVARLLDELSDVNLAGAELSEAKGYLHDLKRAGSLLAALESFTERVADSAMRVIAAGKVRAETRAKLAETRALARFAELAVGVRNLVWDLLDEEQRGVFEDRLRRELFLPNDLEPPAEVGGRGGALAQARTLTLEVPPRAGG